MKAFSENQLLIHYLLGICTSSEQEEVEAWLAEDEHNIRILKKAVDELGREQPLSLTDKNQIKKDILSIIGRGYTDKKVIDARPEHRKLSSKNQKKTFYRTAGFWIKAAAVILIVITASLGSFYYLNKINNSRQKMQPAWHSRTLPYGQTASLRFSDGSVIKLNGGSTLRYPIAFDDSSRVVYLEGEAFFSIAPDKSRPFIVHAGNVTTRVLGTSFNIKAYKKDEKIQVAVAEGRVAVMRNEPEHTALAESSPIILEKNQWVNYQKSVDVVERGEGDIWKMVAWKENVLIFNSEPFDEVARMLERWYGIEIILKGESLGNMIVEGAYEDVSLKNVLESIEYILGVEYTVNEEVVTFQLPEKEREIINTNR